MRIVTDYYDYYDAAQVYAGDTKDVYIRRRFPNGKIYETNEHGLDCHKSSRSTNTDKIEVSLAGNMHVTGHHLIGFCGKIYPVSLSIPYVPKGEWRADWLHGKSGRTRFPEEDFLINDKVTITYDVDRMIQAIKDNERWGYINDINYLKEIVNNKTLLNIFKDKMVPLFVLTSDGRSNNGAKYKVNYAPMLYKYNFDQVFDIYQAYQEIQMFFGGVLFDREHPEPQITDSIVLRDAKGFDNKSFKNSKKKRGRK